MIPQAISAPSSLYPYGPWSLRQVPPTSCVTLGRLNVLKTQFLFIKITVSQYTYKNNSILRFRGVKEKIYIQCLVQCWQQVLSVYVCYCYCYTLSFATHFSRQQLASVFTIQQGYQWPPYCWIQWTCSVPFISDFPAVFNTLICFPLGNILSP